MRRYYRPEQTVSNRATLDLWPFRPKVNPREFISRVSCVPDLVALSPTVFYSSQEKTKLQRQRDGRLYIAMTAPHISPSTYVHAHCLCRMLFLSIISTAYHLLSGCRAARLIVWLWASERGIMSQSTHYRSFRRRVFPVNHWHWFGQTDRNDQETEHEKNEINIRR